MKNQKLFDDVQYLQDTLVAISTGTSYNNTELESNYQSIRTALLQKADISNLIPLFIIKYRSLPAFWGFIKNEIGGYAERRRYLAEAFFPLLDYLEQDNPAVLDGIVANAADITSDYVREIWNKATARRETDPEGAITAARTLIEATCKHILDKQDIKYDDGAELPQLYKLTASQLNLAPSQHTEQQFKQILQGAASVVHGLGSLRNKISDAHAIGAVHARPSSRHATLCVNMAGAISEFLITTYEQTLQKKY